MPSSHEIRIGFEDVPVAIRLAALEIVRASMRPSSADLHNANIQTARLTAGQDPNSIDFRSPEYSAGAQEALSNVIARLVEAMPDQGTVEWLKDENNAKVFAFIASDQVVHESEFSDSGLEALPFLHNSQLIEPALSKVDGDKAWQITGIGRQIYIHLIPQIAESAGMDETLDGVRGILETKQKK
jgi:hypothetical protein